VAVVVLPVRDTGQLPLDFTAQQPFDGDGYRFGTRDATAVVPDAGATSVADVLLVGDSVSWSLLPGLAGWDHAEPDRSVSVGTHISFGCPLSGPGPWRSAQGETPTWPDCDTWLADLPRAIERNHPDVVLMVMGLGDLGGRRIDGEWRDWGDPEFESWFADRVDAVADALEASGATVVWLTYPDVRMADPQDPTADPAADPMNDPGRVDRLNSAIRARIADRPSFRTVDLNGWLRSQPDQFDEGLRDGVHFTMNGSVEAGRWLVPAVLEAAGVPAGVPAGGTGGPVDGTGAPTTTAG
jgi:lysophospholipase L1-like esterase